MMSIFLREFKDAQTHFLPSHQLTSAATSAGISSQRKIRPPTWQHESFIFNQSDDVISRTAKALIHNLNHFQITSRPQPPQPKKKKNYFNKRCKLIISPKAITLQRDMWSMLGCKRNSSKKISHLSFPLQLEKNLARRSEMLHILRTYAEINSASGV